MKFYNKKLRSSAILQSLLIATLVFALLSAILLFFDKQQTVNSKIEQNILINHEFQNMVEFSKSPISESDNSSWKPQSIASSLLSVKNFGLLNVYTGYIKTEQDTFYKGWAIGYADKHWPAIYLAGNFDELKYTGKAEIFGEAFLPSKSVKEVYIEGKSSTVQDFLKSKPKQSDRDFPKEIKETITNIRNTAKRLTGFGNTRLLSEFNSDTIRNSFRSNPLIIQIDQPLSRPSVFEGNIILKSNTPLSIPSSITINSGIVAAPEIRLEAGFKGSGQFWATDSLFISSMAQLNYPSHIVVTGENGYAEIDEGSEYNGEIFLTEKKSFIKIGDKSTVKGNIITNGDIQLQGEVQGSVFAQRFYLKTPTGVYTNTLMDGIINHDMHQKDFLSVTMKGSQKGKVMKWLN
ncbi:bactofilin family protein [Salibacter halophilus]|uniref:Polymer-forming cytoskeletal protein n=1 Tax=Salibacter halophilus TaxID=1803916 RepID=A0A6N6M456_9FLAO|nr:hypothetical protein [Salibacter halophilus]KAB1061971.1 hypothetical protein F3059_12900 [Salibacter halophilus]